MGKTPERTGSITGCSLKFRISHSTGSFKNKVTLLGIDLAKNVFQLLGLNSSGQIILKKRISSRESLVKFIACFPVCTIAMESCGGSNYFARKFLSFGHEVKLIHPAFVKPCVKTNKNDFNDVECTLDEIGSSSFYVFIRLQGVIFLMSK